MIKHIFGLAVILSSLIGKGQDATKPIGAIIGNQTVVPIPVMPVGYPMQQALVYFPDDYFLPANANKRYPMFLFLHGAGEGAHLDITEVTNQSLPYEIKNGLKPYGISPKGDTVKYIVISPHCAGCNGSYSFPQLQYTIPYLYKTYRIDTTCVFVGGLSSGGSCSWSMAMGNGSSVNSASYLDSLMTTRITGIMPMANGGYDNNITNKILSTNLVTWLKGGHSVIYTIGSLDAGYNAIGYFTYSKYDSTYGVPGHWFHKVVVGSPHDATVWNPPFMLTNNWYSPSMNVWQLMWSLRKQSAIVVPPPPPPPPTTLPYPVRIVIKYSDSSCSIIYQHP